MKRKAVQGLAHNMCQMFLGHQVWDDLADVEVAALTVDYTVRANPGRRWERGRHRTWDFRFRCRSTIQAFRGEYSSAAEGTYQFA